MPTKPTGRPRGRPKGAKNIPKIEDFVQQSLAAPIPAPPMKPKGKPRGPWAGMTPEQRSDYAKKLREQRVTQGGGPGRPAGLPQGMSVAEFEARKAEQTPIVTRIVNKMIANGEIPDDPDVKDAFVTAGVIMRTENEGSKNRLAAARLILDFKKAKPTSKVEHTIKTAEEYLDEIASIEE